MSSLLRRCLRPPRQPPRGGSLSQQPNQPQRLALAAATGTGSVGGGLRSNGGAQHWNEEQALGESAGGQARADCHEVENGQKRHAGNDDCDGVQARRARTMLAGRPRSS